MSNHDEKLNIAHRAWLSDQENVGAAIQFATQCHRHFFSNSDTLYRSSLEVELEEVFADYIKKFNDQIKNYDMEIFKMTGLISSIPNLDLSSIEAACQLLGVENFEIKPPFFSMLYNVSNMAVALTTIEGGLKDDDSMDISAKFICTFYKNNLNIIPGSSHMIKWRLDGFVIADLDIGNSLLSFINISKSDIKKGLKAVRGIDVLRDKNIFDKFLINLGIDKHMINNPLQLLDMLEPFLGSGNSNIRDIINTIIGGVTPIPNPAFGLGFQGLGEMSYNGPFESPEGEGGYNPFTEGENNEE